MRQRESRETAGHRAADPGERSADEQVAAAAVAFAPPRRPRATAIPAAYGTADTLST
jgi:hypothetical protein